MKISSKIELKKAKVFWKFLLPFSFVFVLLCFSFQTFAQDSTDFLILAETVRNGSDEEKRVILHKIRNIRTERASRLAIPALNDSSEIVRATAVSSVIFLPKNEAVQLIVPLLQDKSIFVRRETAYALGKVGNSIVVYSLLQTFQSDKSFEVKNAAVIALGEIGDVSAVDALTKILLTKHKDSENFLRRSAARSIGQIAQNQNVSNQQEAANNQIYTNKQNINAPGLIEKFPVFQSANAALLKILQNSGESNDTKREAAYALGEIADTSSIQILRINSNSKDYFLAEISKNSLIKINNSAK